MGIKLLLPKTVNNRQSMSHIRIHQSIHFSSVQV